MTESLFVQTANPWVDAGSYCLAAMADVGQLGDVTHKVVMTAIDLVSDLYTQEAWNKALYSLFPNRPGLTHPRLVDRELFRKSLLELLDQTGPLTASGDCIACGRRSVRRDGKSYYRDYVPLTGAGGMRNFFPAAQGGASYCPACTLAIQFSPLFCIAGARMLLPFSPSDDFMWEWAKRQMESVHVQRAQGSFTGPGPLQAKEQRWLNPRNALFWIVDAVRDDARLRFVEKQGVALRLLEFTNYNQGPDLQLHDLPSEVFRFVYIAGKEYRQAWDALLRRGFAKKYDGSQDMPVNADNRVVDNLLTGKSITGFFRRRETKAVVGGWQLLTLYLREVRDMAQSRIDLIKGLADDIAHLLRKHHHEHNSLRYVGDMERARDFGQFRGVIRQLYRRWAYDPSMDRRLPDFDQIVTIVGPEVRDWRVVKDLILFRLYEDLRDLMQGVAAQDADNDDEQDAWVAGDRQLPLRGWDDASDLEGEDA